MADFSADAERAALAPWTILIGGRVHTAAVVSRPAVVAFFAVMERSKDGMATPEEEEVALRALLRVAFPERPFRQWWRGDPVEQIMALDYRIRQKALESFFASLAPPSPSASGTNGTSASPSS